MCDKCPYGLNECFVYDLCNPDTGRVQIGMSDLVSELNRSRRSLIALSATTIGIKSAQHLGYIEADLITQEAHSNVIELFSRRRAT